MSASDKIPLWALVASAIAGPVLVTGIAWGIGQARISTVEARQERHEDRITENTNHRHRADAELATLRRDVLEIKSDVKKLLERSRDDR